MTWGQFTSDHPPGSTVTGRVVSVHVYGVFVDLDVPFSALLLVPYIAPIGQRKHYPDDYPKTGEIITALILRYGEDTTGEGTIVLTQEHNS